MKRDMELIRKMLLVMEKQEGQRYTSDFGLLDDYDPELVQEHWRLLTEAGLIDACDNSDNTGFSMIPLRMTWHGHDFLANAKDDSIWAEAKSRFGGRIVDVSFSILSKALATIVTSQIGLE